MILLHDFTWENKKKYLELEGSWQHEAEANELKMTKKEVMTREMKMRKTRRAKWEDRDEEDRYRGEEEDGCMTEVLLAWWERRFNDMLGRALQSEPRDEPGFQKA